MLAAGDTFRAAAAEQLQLHGASVSNLRVVAQEPRRRSGSRAFYDALESARAQGDRVVLADTAGRLHNKANLVKELQKIDKIARDKSAGGVYRKVLVLDATTTGQKRAGAGARVALRGRRRRRRRTVEI